MKIVQCGDKYINMDTVIYVEWMEGVDVYMVHFNFIDPESDNPEEPDFKIVLEEQEEIDDMARWLSANAS